jgi:hypothetical protein
LTERHSRNTTVISTDEYRSLKTCPFCYEHIARSHVKKISVVDKNGDFLRLIYVLQPATAHIHHEGNNAAIEMHDRRIHLLGWSHQGTFWAVACSIFKTISLVWRHLWRIFICMVMDASEFTGWSLLTQFLLGLMPAEFDSLEN